VCIHTRCVGQGVCVCARAFSFHCIQHGPRPRVASWQLRMGARARARSPRLHTPFDWLCWLEMTAGVRRVLDARPPRWVLRHWSCGFFVCCWPAAGCLWKKAVCSGAHVVSNHCMVHKACMPHKCAWGCCTCLAAYRTAGRTGVWPCVKEQARTCLRPGFGLV
jgi:hypothetical protein